MLYYSLIYPYFYYGNIIWRSTYHTNLYRLRILQKRIVRIITNSNYDAHTLPLIYQYSILRRCLHDTRSSFIPVRLHPGSILSIYICLHDTNQNCIPERVIPERLHPGSRIGSKFSFQNEICLHAGSTSVM